MANIAIPTADDDGLDPTPFFPFLLGTYDTSSWKISYLNVTMTADTAAEVLKVASEIPQNDERQWEIEELFQRDIDWDRVETQIAPYITVQDKPTFFGALTIAVLPYKAETNEVLPDFNSWDGWKNPAPFDQAGKVVDVGPITLSWYNDWDDISSNDAIQGLITWNKKQMFPVAIDGQHRLAAFKKISKNPALVHLLTKQRVTVQFLIFDERVGFLKPETEGQGDLRVMRDLFIDLNKHAKQVTRDRLILLEDNEPQAICVRAAMSTRLEPDVSALEADASSIPLSLVDWHTGSAKFDRGPYITSVLMLDRLVASILGKAPVSDYLDYDNVKREIDRLEKHLHVDLRHAKDRLIEVRESGQLFVYDREIVDRIRVAFSETWVPQLCKIFRGFKPYREFIQLRKANDSVALDYQHWVYLTSLSGTEHENELERWLIEQDSKSNGKTRGQLNDIATALQEFKRDSNNELAFTVIFQQALVNSWLRFIKFTVDDFNDIKNIEIDIGNLDEEEEEIKLHDPDDQTLSYFENVSKRTDQFLEAVNRVIENYDDFLNLRVAIPPGEADCKNGKFWAGAFLKVEDDAIDFAAAAAVRGADLIHVIVSMIVFDDTNQPDEESDFNEFWNRIYEENSPPFLREIKAAINRMVNSNGGGGQAHRIINAMEINFADEADPEAVFEEFKLNEIKERLKFIWKKLKL